MLDATLGYVACEEFLLGFLLLGTCNIGVCYKFKDIS